LRVARRRAVGDVLAGACKAASWGAADAAVGRPGPEGDRLLPRADGRLDALDVARDAVGIAGGDVHQLDGMLAALGGAPLGRDLVEPGGIGILGKKRAMHSGK